MLDSLKNITATLLATLKTRLALLGNELQAQKIMLAQQVGLGLAMVFCFGLTVLLALALVLSVWWDQRVLVLSLSVFVFFAVALWCYVALRRTLASSHAVFDASLSALQEDLEQLRTAAGKGKTTTTQPQRYEAGE
jgi:uncharacterized membrane protein YqjE